MISDLGIELLQTVVLPAVTGVIGWFASVWRSKQKKEADVLQNVQQIMKMQSEYIAQQDVDNKKTRDMNARLERKLDEKRRSIRKANWCKYTNEGDGCPVLNHEQKVDGDSCDTCKYNIEESDQGQA